MFIWLLIVIAAAFTFITTYFLRKILISRNVLVIPNDRSSHQEPKPQGGGLSIVICFILFLLLSHSMGFIEDKILFEYDGNIVIESAIATDWHGSDIAVSSVLIPKEFTLQSAYPNPFNPVTNLNFGLPVDSKVSIQIYNLQGQVVSTLLKDNMQAGYHSVVWNADNHSSGIYFVQMIAGDYIHIQKIMLVK